MSLPSGYTRVEYIESSGTQYVDSGLLISSSTLSGFKVEADVEIIETSGVWSVSGCGAWTPCVYTGVRADGNYGYGDGATDVTTNIDYTQSRKLYTLDVPNGKYKVNGALDISVTFNTPTGSKSYFISAYNTGSGATCHKEKIYGYKFYDNGTLVRDYIPCKNASGTVGLWDDVNSQFYGNAGTGVFTAGPEVLGSHKTMIGGTIYDVTAGKCMVGGTVYDVQKGLTMVGGTIYEIPFAPKGTPVGNLAVGTIVKTPVNGTAKEFIVVHQGKPSSIYDDSCNGVWLLMKDVYENRQWHSSNVNDYANSTIHSYLNSTFLAMFDSNIQKAIKQVKLPYRAGSGYGKTVTSGASGLSAKIFLLSSTEVNLVHGYEPTNEGACLSYFSGTAQNGSDTKRVAYLNGSATFWWLRSPYCNSSSGSQHALVVSSSGIWDRSNCSYSSGVRPAFILPQSALVDENMNIGLLLA